MEKSPKTHYRCKNKLILHTTGADITLPAVLMLLSMVVQQAIDDQTQKAHSLLCSCCCLWWCSKPVKRAELLARIKAQLRVKTDATWVQSIVKGVLTEDSEAMKILESILPESIISRIQVSLNLCSALYGGLYPRLLSFLVCTRQAETVECCARSCLLHFSCHMLSSPTCTCLLHHVPPHACSRSVNKRNDKFLSGAVCCLLSCACASFMHSKSNAETACNSWQSTCACRARQKAYAFPLPSLPFPPLSRPCPALLYAVLLPAGRPPGHWGLPRACGHPVQ